jgi:cytoskeletal protein RodZ
MKTSLVILVIALLAFHIVENEATTTAPKKTTTASSKETTTEASKETTTEASKETTTEASKEKTTSAPKQTTTGAALPSTGNHNQNVNVIDLGNQQEQQQGQGAPMPNQQPMGDQTYTVNDGDIPPWIWEWLNGLPAEGSAGGDTVSQMNSGDGSQSGTVA